MAKFHALTVATIQKRPPGRHADGGNGLYLEVKPAGGMRKTEGRYWLFRYKSGGKVAWKSLGVFPAVSLKMAREKAQACREAIYRGEDPFKAAVSIPTFAEAVNAFLAVNAKGWKNAKHRAQWTMTLGDTYCAALRKLPVNEIETRHVLEVLSPVWHDKAETARRLRGRIEAILDFAKSKGWRAGENPARWRGNLNGPLSNVKQERRHHAALHFDKVPAFVADLRAKESLSARTLEFIILTAARSGEALNARWPEVDFDQATWTVPAQRMKAKREHVVPLSQPALTILKALSKSAPPAISSSQAWLPKRRSRAPRSPSW